MQRVIDDLRRRMENIDRFLPYISPFTAEVFPQNGEEAEPLPYTPVAP